MRNRELRLRLFGPSAVSDRRRSAHVSRLLKRLHLRGLPAKIPRSRRWRVTQLGHAVMTTAVLLREEDFPLRLPYPEGAARTWEEAERSHILRILKDCGGSQTRAAQVLAINRSTLYKKLKSYGWKKTRTQTDDPS